MTTKIYPSEAGYVFANGFDLSGIDTFTDHIQGIAQAGEEYIILSTSKSNKELILAHGAENKRKVVLVQPIPNHFKHAGGIDVLDIDQNKWRIVVPVYYENDSDSEYKGAILHYLLSVEDGIHKLRLFCITKLKNKAYTVGVVQMSNNNVLIAVVIDEAGKNVQFLEYTDTNGKNCEYRNIRYNSPGYPNSISLIKHYDKIYFVGMRTTGRTRTGEDLIDIYEKENWQKTHAFHAICTAPAFGWGGSARIKDKKVEILVVEMHVQKKDNAQYVRYEKFYLNIKNNSDELKLETEIVIAPPA